MSEPKEKVPENPVSIYTDAEALADGVLIAINGEGGVNRVTRAVFDSLTSFIGDPQFKIIDITELALAIHAMLQQKPSDGWRIGFYKKKMLWLIPNEVGGLTLMFPEDY
jgi:hypothetical protein